MDYVLGAFAVFFVLGVMARYLTMPQWLWTVVQLLLALGCWFLIGAEGVWRIFMMCGVATIIKGFEALLLVTTDSATLDLLRQRRR